MGYVLSREFNRCAVKAFRDMKFMPMEDVAVGIAAEQCNAKCQSEEWVSWDGNGHVAPLRVEHKIMTSSAMLYSHWENLALMKVGEFGDFD